eukprot:TRINITY_DN1522_c0_g1_i1.p1 TRINITY_DN1522_c0_g1~~TRINITY_DN1522_c0_g1_i1.p1  ORF type:complete len:171 (-),score=74.22 TRINITY_DN1522_c0_g1_i1:192-704(-)
MAVRAYGVDENTALVVTATNATATAAVVGTGGVLVADLASATIATSPSWSARGVVTAYATDGDAVDLVTGAVTFAATKVPLEGREHTTTASTSDDIFSYKLSSEEYVRVATSLFDASQSTSTTGNSYQSKPTYQVAFSKMPKSSAADGYNSYNSYVISYSQCSVDYYELI